jgi:hypothetical protein
MQIASEVRPDTLKNLGKSPAIASFVVRQAPLVARAYMRVSGDRRAGAINEVVQWVSQIERHEERRHMRREILPELFDDDSIPLLEEVLRDLSGSDVSDTLEVLVESTQGFGKASIRRVIADFICQRFPEETINWGQHSRFVQWKNVPDVLAEAFALSLEGADRILTVEWMTTNDRCEVWSAFIERASKKQLPQWFVRRAGQDVTVIEPFAQCDRYSARATLALQAIGDQCNYLPIVRSQYFQDFILKIAETGLAGQLVSKAVDSAIAEHVGGRIDDERMLAALSLAPCRSWCEQAPKDHISCLLTSAPDADSWQKAWLTLSLLPPNLFQKVAGYQIISDFTRSFRTNWTEGVAQSWTRIIDRAREELSYEISLRMVMQATAFCFENSRFPLGTVVCAAFPAFYDAVSTDRAADITDDFFGYCDWDKAKKLRKDLIEAYVSSCWPPEQLALTAARAKALRKVIHRLQRKRGGDEYIRMMHQGLVYLGTNESHAVRGELSAILSDPDFFEPWD